MTFNTTSLPLRRALRDKKLLVREAFKPRSETQSRYLLVDPRIDGLLDGHIYKGIFPAVEAEKLIGIFSAGFLLTATRRKTARKPDVEQIEGYDEVWALCPRKPKPGWRILGRFHAQGVLIALRAWDKRSLFNNYAKAAQEVIDDWNDMGLEPPHTGATVGDYLGGVVRDADAQE